MIEERLLKRAVKIRKNYLKITRDVSVYEEKAKKILKVLENTLKQLDSIQSGIKNKSIINPEEASKKIMSVLLEAENEGQRLEKIINPLNDEIEKLREEENELYRLIKEKNPTLSDDSIIKEIQIEIKKENLS